LRNNINNIIALQFIFLSPKQKRKDIKDKKKIKRKCDNHTRTLQMNEAEI